ncbi:MAG TPA: hypothetical protein ACFYEK_18055 [Candidatus Wunengus sp. YC60]
MQREIRKSIIIIIRAYLCKFVAKLLQTMIKVGTSGFSFPDWVSSIYPSDIKKGDMLEYYEKKLGFGIAEINSTYY